MGYRAQSVTTPRGCAKEGYPSLTTLHPSRPKVQTQPVSFALNSLRSVGICYVAAKEAWPKTSARANLLRLLLLSRPEIIPGSTALGGMERCRQHRPSWFSKLGSSIVLRHESTALLYGYWNYSKYGINSALLEKRFFPKHMGPKTRKNVFAETHGTRYQTLQTNRQNPLEARSVRSFTCTRGCILRECTHKARCSAP